MAPKAKYSTIVGHHRGRKRFFHSLANSELRIARREHKSALHCRWQWRALLCEAARPKITATSSGLLYTKAIYPRLIGGDKGEFAFFVFGHEYHALAFDAAHGAGREVGYDDNLLADNIFGCKLCGNA